MNIKQSPAGKIVKTTTGYAAFLPHPLPPHFEWNNALINALSKANHLLGQLAREGQKLPNPHILMRPFITREAVLSSKIEGTQATVGQVLAQEAGVVVKNNPSDLQEVKNYIDALDYGLKRLSELPLSLRLIKEIHEKLMRGVRGDHATPGEFRRTQNWIGLPGCTLTTAKYVPPTPDDLYECLGTFENFLHDKQLPILIHIALCHYQFEAIHPFLDGNGRVGRLLITLLMIERQLLPLPLLYLSAFFEATRDEYYQQLYNVSAHGAWNDWFTYFLNGITVQSADVLSRAERINELISLWQYQAIGSSAQTFEVIAHFATNPFLTVKKVTTQKNISLSTAQRIVKNLESLGIIAQINDAKRDRVYCATKILEILEEPASTTLSEI